MDGWEIVWTCDRMEGCLDGWVNGNKFFHYKITGFGTYTHRHITRTGERKDINANIF